MNYITKLKLLKKILKLIFIFHQKHQLEAYNDFLWLVRITKDKHSYDLIWKGEDEFELPGSSKLLFKPSLGQGISLEKSWIFNLKNSKSKGW